MSDVQGQPLPDDERDGEELRVQAVGAIAEVPAAQWDACANPAPHTAKAGNAIGPSLQAGDEQTEAKKADEENVYNPFISHDFLSALEESG